MRNNGSLDFNAAANVAAESGSGDLLVIGSIKRPFIRGGNTDVINQ